MRVLIAPVGMQDPHGKLSPMTGEATEGSILQIARRLRPDRAILLPTSGAQGTEDNARETREWLCSEGICSEVDIRSIDLPEPQDYEAAIRVYGAALTEIVAETDGTYFVNVSSGTPAIKSACMMAAAEGVLPAEAWYADDPTKTTRNDAVRRLDVGFLRRSALRQRITGLLAQGHFWAAREACRELEVATPDEGAREAVSGLLVWLTGLKAWDERQYDEAMRQTIEARRNEALTACSPCADLLRRCHDHLHRRSTPGWTAWDLCHMAGRLALQGRYAIALEWAWVAMEASTKPLGVSGGDRYVDALVALEHDGARAFFRRRIEGRPAEEALRGLKRSRNYCVHEGRAASPQDAERMLVVCRSWLRDVAGCVGADSPVAPGALGALAEAFCSLRAGGA